MSWRGAVAPTRELRQPIAGLQFDIVGLPSGIADKAAQAMTRDEDEAHRAGLVQLTDMAEY